MLNYKMTEFNVFSKKNKKIDTMHPDLSQI